MDALLVVPPEYRYVRSWTETEYLGLEYLASFIRSKGFDAKILNCNLHVPIKHVVKVAIEEKPTIIGISIPTLPNLPGAYRIVRALHAAGYHGHICLGGHTPTFAQREIFEIFPRIDSIVVGEGELTFLELLQKIQSGESISDITGIAFKNGDEVTTNQTRDLIRNIDQLPFPARDMLVEIVNLSNSRTAAIASGRGCYGRCTFCSVHSFYKLSRGPRIRLRSPDNIVDEIAEIVTEHNINSFFFVDDNFIGPGKAGKLRGAEIAEKILTRNLKINFTISCRANDVEMPLFKLLKKAGLTRVFVGLESGVQSVLDRFQKGTKVEQNIQAINVLRKAGITWDAGFIIYDPDMTFGEFKENVEFLRSTSLYRYPAAVLLLNGLTAYPGTPVERLLKDSGRIKYPSSEAESFIIGNVREGLEPLEGKVSKLLGPDYDINDDRMQKIRQIIDLAEAIISPKYDTIWPLVTEWRRWVDSVTEITGLSANRLKDISNLKLHLEDQMERWIANIGTLIINILETILELFEGDGQFEVMDNYHKKILSMIDQYDLRHFNVSFNQKISEIQELLNKTEYEIQIDGLCYLLSMESRQLALSKFIERGGEKDA